MDIEKKLQEFQELFLPEDFKWRRGQKEAIIQIMQTYLDGKYKVVVVDAPVGSGKSLIAVASSWLMNQKGRDGYILASDVSLQGQYEMDLSKMKMNWGSVKGIDNYICSDNDERVSMGTCKIRGKVARNMPCYDTCPYYSARNKASTSDTSILNYAYWLIMMNYVQNSVQVPPFETRDFVICDEAHKIIDIVQNQYSPKFDKNVNRRLDKMTTFFSNHNVKNHYAYAAALDSAIMEINNTSNQQKLYSLLTKIQTHLGSYLDSIGKLKRMVDREYKNAEPPKDWKRTLSTGAWAKDLYTKLKDYLDIIDQTDIGYLIKNPQGDDIIFNCLYESYLMNKYFHKWAPFTVLMSATFSDPKEYLGSIAIKGAKYIKMESNFDFTNSPIYFYNKRKMSMNHIEENMPWLIETVNKIVMKHSGQRGVIHTASYNLTMRLYEGLLPEYKDRVMVYSGTEEKRFVLEEMKRYEDKIIMGPSLLEGLDLKHDWSRFQVFAKVPYLSLGDKFVKAKMDVNPEWYRWKAAVNVLQGVGRSVRSEDDWAITYILDGSLADLMHNSPGAFPPEFRKRMRIVKG